jgi:hypothetical protein
LRVVLTSTTLDAGLSCTNQREGAVRRVEATPYIVTRSADRGA